MSVRAVRTAVNVVPNHHLMSPAVTGPNVRIHLPVRWACASRTGIGVCCLPSHLRVVLHLGRDVVHAPSLGPRTMSPRAESAVSTRGASGTVPPQRFPGAGS